MHHKTLVWTLGLTVMVGGGLAEAQDWGLYQRRLGISEETAHVTDVFPPTLQALPDYILIQDLHKHPEVQNHIATILLRAASQWGIQQVLIEGAFSAVDLSMFQVLTGPMRSSILALWVNEGNLSGAEWAALTVWGRLQLMGIEEPALYMENLKAYQNVKEERLAALKELDRLEQLQYALHLAASHPLVRQLQRTRDLIKLKLTPTEYAEYMAFHALTPFSPTLAPVVTMAEKFYATVEKRNKVFLDKAEKSHGHGPHIMVVGGFHTTGMSSLLRARGKSFVVLSPCVTQNGFDYLYEQKMLENMNTLQILDPTL